MGSGGSQPSSSFLTALMAFKSSAEGAGGGGKAAIALVVNQIDYPELCVSFYFERTSAPPSKFADKN